MLVLNLMAPDTEGNEVLCSVVPQVAAKSLVMHVQIAKRPTLLTAPPIPLEDFIPEETILLRIEFQPRYPLAGQVHGNFNSLRHTAGVDPLACLSNLKFRKTASSRIIL